MNTRRLNEAAGPLAGLPKHWIKYLTARYGRGYPGYDMAGENSKTEKLPRFEEKFIKKALKDPANIAIIGKKEGQPLFMISRHDEKSTRFYFFEAEKGKGRHDSKGTGYYGGRRRGRYHYADYYAIDEIMDIVDKMKGDKAFADLEIFAISKDPKRAEKISTRAKEKEVRDPLVGSHNPYSDNPSPAQVKRAKTYSDIKRPKLDARVQFEVNKVKAQVNDAIDKALEKAIADMKKGYSWSVSNKAIAADVANAINISGLARLAQAYSAIKGDYNPNPAKMAKDLKQTGLA